MLNLKRGSGDEVCAAALRHSAVGIVAVSVDVFDRRFDSGPTLDFKTHILDTD